MASSSSAAHPAQAASLPARPAGARGVVGWTILLVLSLAAFANAAGYILYAGNPLLSSDAWYFVDAFLRKAMEDGASIQDYYVKRSADDHAQPLLKLLLLANAEWFGLDFVLEALAGLLFALLTYVVLARAALANGPDGRIGWRQGFGLGVVAACLVTLNAGMVFNWSLVTLGYLSYLLAALAGFAAWRVLAKNGGRGNWWHLQSPSPSCWTAPAYWCPSRSCLPPAAMRCDTRARAGMRRSSSWRLSSRRPAINFWGGWCCSRVST